MGQNLESCVVLSQKCIDVKNEVKISLPFSKLPNKAVFNYITPVNYHDQQLETITSNNFLSSNFEQQNDPDGFFTTICNYKSIKDIKVKWNSFIKMKQKDYLQEYDIVKNVIGKGGFGVVRKVKSKFTNQIRVAKVVRKRLMKDDDMTKLFTQLYIMKMLDHPNIIKLYEVYDYEDQFILIIQMCTGGQVFQKTKKKKIPQRKAASIIKQVLRALIYMHNQKIVHRDIKPENMLFQNQSKNTVKLIDFGIAAKIEQNTFLEDRIGTPSYIAPEIIYKKYNQKCDVWAAGISFYQFICGKTPFNGQNDSQVLIEILRGEIPFSGSIWQKVSKQCKSVIKLMLTKKFEDRPSAKQLFEHNYFCSIEENQKADHTYERNSVINNIHHFRFKNKLQAVVQTFIASQLLTQQQKQTLVEIFKQFDVNNDGVISNEELTQALKSKGSMTESKIRQVMTMIDINGSGEIDYTEFLVANCDSTVQLTRQRLKQVFQYFDTDKSGTITYSEVAEFLQDYESSEEEIKNIFKLVDANGDGNISEDEFIDLIVKKASSFTYINEAGQIEKEKLNKRQQFRANKRQNRDKARIITFQGINQLLSGKNTILQSLLSKK